MKILFCTGNAGKFEEAKEMVPDIEQLAIELPEIQELDPRKVIEAKLHAALAYAEGPCVVEDTGLYLDCLNGFPGPLVKWFLQVLGREGIYDTAARMGNTNAEAKAVIGYAKNPADITFFEGSIRGAIVAPRGDSGFGWDPIFQPEGFSKTFAEMEAEEKNSISHRRKAFEQFQKFLQGNTI